MACAPIACTQWAAVTVPAPPAPMQVYHRATRVTLKDTRAYELVDVVIVTDSLFGTTADEAEIRRSFALPQVSRVEIRKPSGARTLGLVALIALVVWRVGSTDASASP